MKPAHMEKLDHVLEQDPVGDIAVLTCAARELLVERAEVANVLDGLIQRIELRDEYDWCRGKMDFCRGVHSPCGDARALIEAKKMLARLEAK